MPYAQGPYTNFSLLPSLTAGKLSSSRKIDFAKGDYVLNADGSFAAMDDLVQRVVLLCAFAIKKRKFVTPRTLNAYKDDIRKALTVLTGGSEPLVKLIEVTADGNGQGRVSGRVTFLILATNTKKTVSF